MSVTFLNPPSVRSLERNEVSLPGRGGFGNKRPAGPLPNDKDGRREPEEPAAWSPSPASDILKHGDKTR